MSETALTTTKIDLKELPAYKVLELLLTGSQPNQRMACAAIGISVDTFSRAIKKNPELGKMYSEYTSKLKSGLALLLEQYHSAEQVFAASLIETLESPEVAMQTRVMAHNKLQQIFGDYQKSLGVGSGIVVGPDRNDQLAAELLTKNLAGARLQPAISKVTVEFENSAEVIDAGLIPAEEEAEPEEPD